MGKDPAILFYTADFRQGTMLFTDEECGQYIRLLCDQHQNGHLPEYHMKNICHSCDSPVWGKFVKDKDGLWYNEKLDEVIEKRKKYSESRRINRLGKKKKTYDSTHEKHMSPHMENENGNENRNKNYSLGEEGKDNLEFTLKRCSDILSSVGLNGIINNGNITLLAYKYGFFEIEKICEIAVEKFQQSSLYREPANGRTESSVRGWWIAGTSPKSEKNPKWGYLLPWSQ